MEIISQSILFRHGARGPGDSELACWESNHSVVTQWKDEEIENLSNIGLLQMSRLGSWFASRFSSDSSSMLCRFFSSKSSRAALSGQIFINSFKASFINKPNVLTNQSVSDADLYFRPWKVYLDIEKSNKAKRTSVEWQSKAQENINFLRTLSEKLQMKSSISCQPERTLWGLTHVFGLILCEQYWPQLDGEHREALSILLPPELRREVAQLACWVWDKRFIASGFQVDLGGWIFLDMVQNTFNFEKCTINIYSGHDYTVMTLLAAMGLLTHLSTPLEWGAYVIFELWDDATNDNVSCSNYKSSPRLRVKFNPCPFQDSGHNDVNFSKTDSGKVLDSLYIHETSENIMADWSMSDVKFAVEQVCTTLEEHGRGIPPGFVIPSYILQHIS